MNSEKKCFHDQKSMMKFKNSNYIIFVAVQKNLWWVVLQIIKKVSNRFAKNVIEESLMWCEYLNFEIKVKSLSEDYILWL